MTSSGTTYPHAYPQTYLAPPDPYQRAPFYQQPYQSQQTFAPPKTLKKKRSAWRSMANLGTVEEQATSGAVYHAPPRPYNGGSGENPLARGLNQGAAFCDNVAARLNEVLSRLDGGGDGHAGERGGEEHIDALVRGMGTDEDAAPIESSRFLLREEGQKRKDKQRRHNPPRSRSDTTTTGAGAPLINFKKTWLYSNSCLPPHLLPFKVYLPTWQILTRAAEASKAVYSRPCARETEDFIDADWRQGTKAMVLKTVLLDEKNLVVFAIRGSKWNFVDWAVNFRPAPTLPEGFLDDGGNACHAGFLSVARAMVKPVAERLRRILQEDPSRAGSSLVITGHSAGGAVASLLFMHMLSTTVESELNCLTGCFRRVHCVVFGAPPVSLLPLRKPEGGPQRWRKNLFFSFVNEGDPVVRADKGYIYSLGRLIAAPSPETAAAKETSIAHGLRQKVSRQRLASPSSPPPVSSHVRIPPVWPVPESTLSNAGRLILLRRKPGKKSASEAVCVDDEQLRDRIFGDPAMHEMALYKRRIDELAVTAVTGREGG